MGRSEVSTSVVEWSVVGWSGLKVLATGWLPLLEYIYIYIYIYISFHFLSLYTRLHVLYVSVQFCKLCFFYFYVYVFLLLCMFRSRYSALLFCSVFCLCVLCTVLLPPGVNPLALNKIHHIISCLLPVFRISGLITLHLVLLKLCTVRHSHFPPVLHIRPISSFMWSNIVSEALALVGCNALPKRRQTTNNLRCITTQEGADLTDAAA